MDSSLLNLSRNDASKNPMAFDQLNNSDMFNGGFNNDAPMDTI